MPEDSVVFQALVPARCFLERGWPGDTGCWDTSLGGAWASWTSRPVGWGCCSCRWGGSHGHALGHASFLSGPCGCSLPSSRPSGAPTDVRARQDRMACGRNVFLECSPLPGLEIREMPCSFHLSDSGVLRLNLPRGSFCFIVETAGWRTDSVWGVEGETSGCCFLAACPGRSPAF